MIGPGKYDKECETALDATRAQAVLLIVLDGVKGSGFSMTIDVSRGFPLFDVPRILRDTAADIEASYAKS